MSKDISTIKLSRKTKDRLEHIKVYARETYEDILIRMLDFLNLCRLNPELARARLIQADKERRRNFKIGKPEEEEREDGRERFPEKEVKLPKLPDKPQARINRE